MEPSPPLLLQQSQRRLQQQLAVAHSVPAQLADMHQLPLELEQQRHSTWLLPLHVLLGQRPSHHRRREAQGETMSHHRRREAQGETMERGEAHPAPDSSKGSLPSSALWLEVMPRREMMWSAAVVYTVQARSSKKGKEEDADNS